MSTCRFCQAAIQWVRLDSERSIPVNPQPDPTGNVAAAWQGPTLTGYVLSKGRPLLDGYRLFRPHKCRLPPGRPPRSAAPLALRSSDLRLREGTRMTNPSTEGRSAGFGIITDNRGQLEVEPYRSEDAEPDEAPLIMVTIRPANPWPVNWALDADEARALAAALVAMADDLDAGRWPEPGEPRV